MKQPILYIGNSLIDLAPDTLITYTYRKFDASRPQSRFVNSTNTFKATLSENNIREFGYSNDERSRSSFPYRVQNARLINEGIEQKGTLIVRSLNKGFDVIFFEEVYDVFAAVDGKPLSEILPIADSPWTEEEMDSNRATTSGLISALIHFNQDPTIIFDSNLFLPSFFYHTLVKEVFEFSGVTLSGNILTDARFTDLVVPFPSAQFTPLNDVDAPSFIDKGAAGATTGSSFNFSYMNNIEAGDLLLFHVISYGLGTISVNSSWTSGDGASLGSIAYPSGTPVVVSQLYRKYADGTETGTENVSRSGHSGSDAFMGQVYRFRGDLNITIEDSDNSQGDAATITWPATTVSGGKRTLAALVANINGSAPGTPSGYTESATDTNGSNTYLELNTKEDTNSGASTTATNGSANGWLVWHLSIYNVKQDVNWNQYLSEIDCTDLLRDFFNRFLVIPKQVNNVLYLKTIEEIITDRAGASDWTGKMVKNIEEIEYHSNYAQTNNFDYTDNKDFVNDEDLGRGVLTVDDTTLKVRNTLYKTFFENCKTENTTGHKVARMPIYNTESLDAGDIQEAPGKKLLTIKSRTSEPAITFDQTARTDYKLAYFVDADLAKDTGFQYFINQFWPSFGSSLQRYKSVTKYYYLTVDDVVNRDPHKMVYDADGYYIVNGIPNFVNSKIAKVNLLKVG